MAWATGAKTVQARSLSARRAWIEIYFPWPFLAAELVALRKESVDRNLKPPALQAIVVVSLSARRAWIEIFSGLGWVGKIMGRSPQGERG